MQGMNVASLREASLILPLVLIFVNWWWKGKINEDINIAI